MMETILVNAEPLMVIIVTYFVAQFAFSSIAQNLGSQVWLRWIVAVPCLYTFIGYLSRLLPRPFYFAINYVYYSPLMWFIVQPITIYLVVFFIRLIRERRKKKEDRISWKELAKL